jgi:hypothetical protein
MTITPGENGRSPAAETGYQYEASTDAEGGMYEPVADAHLYDLTGESLDSPDDAVPPSPDDRLVVTAAWRVPANQVDAVRRWFSRRREEPSPWLTPWRSGEPAIDCEYWLDDATGTAPQFLVVRLDSPYLAGLPLRASLDAALGRFQELRMAVEKSLSAALTTPLPRATREWLTTLAGDEDPDLLVS